MRRLINIAVWAVLMSPLPSITAFAQSDAGQDVHDAQSYEDDDRDRCNGMHDPACQKTPKQIEKQKEADIALPLVIIGLFIGWAWIRKKLNGPNG